MPVHAVIRSGALSALLSVAVGVACGSPSIAQQTQPPGPSHEHHAPLKIGPVHSALKIPEGIRTEHEKIHGELVEATTAPGPVGAAARELAGILHPHFVREEEIALPPLGLLGPLARGEYSPQMDAVLPMTDALRSELAQMLREHGSIAEATRRLEQVAKDAGSHEVQRLARDLMAHAKSEEEVFYPAAILVGDMVRARAKEQAHSAAAH